MIMFKSAKAAERMRSAMVDEDVYMRTSPPDVPVPLQTV